MRFGIGGKLFSGRRERKGLDEFIATEKSISLSRAPTARDILNCGADENQRPLFFIDAFLRELIDESFNVKLPEHEFFLSSVDAKEADVFVRFPFRVLFLRRINRLVLDLDKTVPEDERICALGFAAPRFALHISFPTPKKYS